MTRPRLLVTVVFAVLAVVLEGLMTFHWFAVLQPRLEVEATAHARILAESQATTLAGAIAGAAPEHRSRAILDAMDRVLLLRDEATDIRFFHGIRLAFDYDVVDAPEGTLDLSRFEATAAASFTSDVPLFSPDTDELLGIATFRVSQELFQRFRDDVKRNLLLQSTAVLAILALIWTVLNVVLRKLQRQTAERERAERELSLHERRYRRLLDNLTSYFVYSADRDGRRTFVSESVTAVLGYAPAEYARDFERYLTDSPLNEPARRGRTASPHSAGSYEIEVRAKDGSCHQIEQTELPVLDDEGRLVAVDGIARDVTAERRSERELRAARDEAEAANVAKSQFLANVSHEVRTPLNAVLGMTGLCLKTELTPKQRNYLSKADSSARLLLEIINDILDISKIEARKLELQAVDFDLDDVLDNLAAIVGYRAAEKGLDVFFSAARDVPRSLRGDPLRLGQVLLNLTSNAIKFTEHGEVVVAIELGGHRGDEVSLDCAVRDTGIGIAAAARDSLFEPFTQGDTSATRRFGGTGLGLAICRRLVEMMGGGMSVDSRPGHGSTFRFTAVLGIAETSGEIPQLGRAELRGLPALVVDDSQTARDVFQEMLSSFSIDVACADSGEHALARMQQAAEAGAPYRLVVLDWRMPGIDGIETVRRIRASRELGDQPGLVLVTAYGRDEVQRDAEQAGADAFISKPVSPSTLFNAVIEALAQHHAAERRAETRRRKVAPAPRRFAPAEVLLVEDKPLNREVARDLLAGTGLRLSEAIDGACALKRLAERRFDAVLMDVQMPNLDGIEATRRIRAERRHRDLPIIAMTAHAMAGDRERFLAAGMSDYIAKPIEESELLQALGRWLPLATAEAVPNGRQEPEAREEPEEPEEVTAEQEEAAGNSAPPEDDAVPASLPGLDLEEAVGRLGGRRDLILRLVGSFCEENREFMAELRQALRDGDRAKVKALAHSIRGTAGVIGASEVATAAGRLEKLMDGGDDYDDALASLDRALGQVLRAGATLPAAVAADEESSEEEEATVPDGTPPVEVDADRLRPLLAQLAEQIDRNSLRARSSVTEVADVVRGSVLEAPLKALQRSLQGLDFDAAKKQLADIAEGLAADV